MTQDEYDSAFRFAAALWPQAFVPGSQTVQFAWAKSLMHYTHTTLCRAFEQISTSRPDFPPLSVVVSVCKEINGFGYEPVVVPLRPRLVGPKASALEEFVASMKAEGLDRTVGAYEARAYRVIRRHGSVTNKPMGQLIQDADNVPLTDETYASVPIFLGEMVLEDHAADLLGRTPPLSKDEWLGQPSEIRDLARSLAAQRKQGIPV